MSLLRKIYTAPIRFYRKYISPNTTPRCRYAPTCSQYALEAIEEWGIFCGTLMGLWRLLRCNPLFKGGFDPVPQRKHKKSKKRKNK
ncbi:MAG: membrane protein insertion efficiency factor YidD [Oscillospiraceae bacterium]|nr:membrane protein insertion efficiency factor YidD [Oscillospiraceae bacterium]